MDIPTEGQKDLVDSAYQELLDKTDPRVADRLRDKFDQDIKSFSEAAKVADPSKGDPSYWAKNSCKRCYGRGIIGKRHVFNPGEFAVSGDAGYENVAFTLDMKCSCGKRAYQRWLADFRVEYNSREEGEVNDVYSK